jgi:imidazole glycerol-phosphate synthase subunit HisF
MLTKRLIACLDVDAGRVVKGTRFVHLRDAGDPAELARRYDEEGADEVVLLDISATHHGRAPLLEGVRRAAEQLTVPLTVGGGMRSVGDVAQALRAGADKVALNSAAVAEPALVSACAARFGSQCIVVSIDARANADGWEVVVRGGRQGTGREVVGWAEEVVRRGAGELLLTCVDRDGCRSGYELALTRAVASSVDVPVVASGGAGNAEHVRAVLQDANADAALLAGILHDGTATVAGLKQALLGVGIPVRR